MKEATSKAKCVWAQGESLRYCEVQESICYLLATRHKLAHFSKLLLIMPVSFVNPVLLLHRTYADKLSPKVVQSLLDLLCSQLKNLLSQAGVMLMTSFGEKEDGGEEEEEEEKKTDLNGDGEKKDFRGIVAICCFF